MEKLYFVSDLHFGVHDQSREREKENRFFAFLKSVKSNGKALYILGDLFDYWFDYKHVVPKGFHRILTKLEDLIERGIEIHLIVGNHDYWVGKRFASEMGIHVYFDPVKITANGKRFYLHHGDGLNERDKGYRILRSVLRNRLNIFLYRLLHPDIGIGLAKRSSRTSRNHSLNGKQSEQEALRYFAQQKLIEGYDFVIMGHHHTPEQFEYNGRLYINLGDWIHHSSYAIFDGETVLLKYWNSKEEVGADE